MVAPSGKKYKPEECGVDGNGKKASVTSYTVCGPNKGTEIREFFPYLGQNWEIYQIRECQNFPCFIEKIVKNRLILSKMSRFSGLS